ncbi:MAG: ABC transporter permease, partial [Pseudorhodobacter sp.]|nr:ABC transporter permease [Pseudorhodobacter sp.]
DFARGGVQLAGVKLPYLSLLAVVVLVLVWAVLEHTAYGRRLYAIGGNAEAARLAGIRVARLRMSALAITGFGAAGAGLLCAARVASANPTQGAGLMLDAIAAVFLGMTMGPEGEPRVLATLVGVLILGILNNGLTQMQVDSYVREMLVGSIVIAAVAISSIGRRT